MVWAAMAAEALHYGTDKPSCWQSSLAEHMIPQPHRQDLEVDEHVHPRHKHNHHPAKNTPPPPTINLDSVSLADRIASLQSRALIGKWHFPDMEDDQMRTWLGSIWRPLIGYVPIIVRLMKDWYSFHFLKVKDLDTIWALPWVHGRSFLALHRRYIGFNPLQNTPQNNLIWVKLPALPIELWKNESLSHIGNAIGKFVYVDPKCLGARDKWVAWILIEKEYRGGFPDHIDLVWGELSIHQRLDY